MAQSPYEVLSESNTLVVYCGKKVLKQIININSNYRIESRSQILNFFFYLVHQTNELLVSPVKKIP